MSELHCGRLGPFRLSGNDLERFFPEACGLPSLPALNDEKRVGIFFAYGPNGSAIIKVNGECGNMTQDGCIQGVDCVFTRKLLGV